jgi:polysaccharide biosynthesis transport protein
LDFACERISNRKASTEMASPDAPRLRGTLLPTESLHEPPGIAPGDIAEFVRRRAVPLIAGFLTMLAAAAIVSALLPATYRSSASFLVERRDPSSLSSALAVLDRMGAGQGTETEIELLQSRRVLEPVVESLALHTTIKPAEVEAEVVSAGRDAQPGLYRVRTGEGTTSVEAVESGTVLAETAAGNALEFAGVQLYAPTIDGTSFEVEVLPFLEAVGRAQERISASTASPEADLVQLSCEGPTPDAARNLCSAVSTSYLQLRAELQRAEANAAAEFLAGQVEQARTRLLAAEDELQSYEGANRLVALSERANEEVRRFAGLQAQREQLDAERRALTEWIASIQQGGAGSSVRDLASFPTFFREQNQVVTQLIASLVELENERSSMMATRTARTPEVASIDERIGQIEAQLAQLASSYEQALGTQIRALDESLDMAGNQLAGIPTQQIESARLERQVSLLEELYRFLETRLHEAEVAQAVNLPSVRIVDEASLPYRPAWPNVPLNLGLGGFLGLLSGIGLAMYREHTDRRLRERLEVERETGLTVLGMIPRLKHPGPLTAVVHAPALLASNGHRAKLLPERELALEAFRSILADLRFLSTDHDAPPITVAVTSASRGEGKTFTACNLALARAATGARTILIDADARASGVASFFGLPPRSSGLTDLLSNHDPVWETAIHRLEIEGAAALEVLPAGSSTARSAALLEGPGMMELLARARRKADFVVVDTPPLNVLTDAAMIASRVDAVIVVVRGGITEREALQHTLRRLQHAHGKVVGIVLNDAALPTHYTSYSHAV